VGGDLRGGQRGRVDGDVVNRSLPIVVVRGIKANVKDVSNAREGLGSRYDCYTIHIQSAGRTIDDPAEMMPYTINKIRSTIKNRINEQKGFARIVTKIDTHRCSM
jgi:hypothetical protein